MPAEPQFARQLKQVLNHLYDYAYVQNHPFSQWFDESIQPGVSRSQLLRRIIVDAIEQMNPGPRFSPRSAEARSYQILVQRFVEGRNPAEVSQELGIVERQLFRDQREAISALVSLLWERRSCERVRLAQLVRGDPEKMLLTEVERLGDGDWRQRVDLCELLRDAKGLFVHPERNQPVCPVTLDCPAGPLVVSGDRTLLRQSMLQAFEGLFSYGELDGVTVQVGLSEAGASIRYLASVRCARDCARHLAEHAQIVGHILQPLQGEVSVGIANAAVTWLLIRLPVNRPVVLLIEDNEDAGQLLQRYLADQYCHLVRGESARRGVELARELEPVAVILDLMMPEEDGWEALQRLKADPAVSDIPIIVYSVLPQESLARSLGAYAYLRKPASREAVLGVLTPFLELTPG